MYERQSSRHVREVLLPKNATRAEEEKIRGEEGWGGGVRLKSKAGERGEGVNGPDGFYSHSYSYCNYVFVLGGGG